MTRPKRSRHSATLAAQAFLAFVVPLLFGAFLFVVFANPIQRAVLPQVLGSSLTWMVLVTVVVLTYVATRLLLSRDTVSSSLPLVVLGSGLAFSLYIWLVLLVEDQADVQKVVQARVFGIAQTIEQDFVNRRNMLHRMARRWERDGGTAYEDWAADAALYVAQKPGYQAIEWIEPTNDGKFEIKWVIPLKGNEAALDLDLCFEERRCAALNAARDRGTTSVSQSIDLVQGGKGFLLYEPTFIDGVFDGFITGVFRIDPLIDRLLGDFPEHIELRLLEPLEEGSVELYACGTGGELLPHLAASTSITLANNQWIIEGNPTRPFLTAQASPLPHAFLATCLLLSLFLAAATYFGTVAQARSRLLAEQQREQRLVTDNVPALIASFDREKRYRLVNQVYAYHFGIDREAFPGLHPREIFGDEVFSQIEPRMDQALKGEDVRFETQAPDESGELRWVSAHYVPDFDGANSCRGFYALVQDIHEEKLAKEALRESEQRFQYAAEGSADGLWDWFDITKDEVWWSPRFYELLGYKPDEIVSGVQAYFELIHPDDVARSTENMDRLLRDDNPPLDTEIRLCTRGGEYRWFRSRSKLFINEATGVRRMAGSIQDVHAEHEAKEALARTQERFRVAVAGSSDGLWDWFDINQDRAWWSPSYYEMLGFEPHEFEPTLGNFRQLLHPDDQSNVYAAVNTSVKDGTPFDVEYRLRHKSGEYRWFRGRAKVHSDDSSGITRMAGSLQDISARKLAEEALKESEERLRLAVTGTMDGLWDWNVRTGEVWYATQWKSQLGYADDEFAHTFEAFEKHVHPDDLEGIKAAIDAHFSLRTPYDIEYRMKTKSGEYRWHRARGQALRDEQGEVYRMAGSNQDIHAQKEAEELATRYLTELRTANEDLKNRNQELDEFTYIASHDLQEPLRKLSNFTELLREDIPTEALSEDAQFDIDTIQSAAKRMRILVQDLLELSRSGRRDMELEDIALDTCLDRALDSLSIRIEETGATVERSPLPFIRGDYSLFTQVFQNLVGNAIKFSAARSPTIRITSTPRDAEWVISVSDDGIGIDEQFREQIFAPFKRLHGRGEYEGSGIGLTICRKIIDRHGGIIWVEGTPGGGTTFKFTVPKSGAASMERAV